MAVCPVLSGEWQIQLDALKRSQVAGRDRSPQVWSDAAWRTAAKDSCLLSPCRKDLNTSQKGSTEPSPAVHSLGLHRIQANELRNRAIEVHVGSTSECPRQDLPLAVPERVADASEFDSTALRLSELAIHVDVLHYPLVPAPDYIALERLPEYLRDALPKAETTSLATPIGRRRASLQDRAVMSAWLKHGELQV